MLSYKLFQTRCVSIGSQTDDHPIYSESCTLYITGKGQCYHRHHCRYVADTRLRGSNLAKRPCSFCCKDITKYLEGPRLKQGESLSEQFSNNFNLGYFLKSPAFGCRAHYEPCCFCSAFFTSCGFGCLFVCFSFVWASLRQRDISVVELSNFWYQCRSNRSLESDANQSSTVWPRRYYSRGV